LSVIAKNGRVRRYAVFGQLEPEPRTALSTAEVEIRVVTTVAEVRDARATFDAVVLSAGLVGLDAVVVELCDLGIPMVVVDDGQLDPSALLGLGRSGVLAVWDGRVETLATAQSELHDERSFGSGVHRAQDRFLRLLRSVPAAVWSFDLQRCHETIASLEGSIDEAVVECSQHVRSHALNEPAAAYRDVAPIVAEALLRAWFSGDRLPHVEVDVKRDGQVRALLVSGAMPSGDDYRQVLVVGLDTTEHRELTRALLASQRLEAVGRLAAGIAHDFKNILTIIRSYTDLVADEVPEDSAAHADLEVMRDAADRATALVAQLLAFSRKQPQVIEKLDLNDVVARVQKLVARPLGEDIEVSLDLCAMPLPVSGDRSQLEQVLLNLAVNARDAMPSGGRLRFRTALRRRADSWVHPVGYRIPAGSYACLEVVDDGIGMSAETLERVFEPFFTTKADRGSGLGLATAYGIVKQHGGYIAATSQLGAGTTFEILLPLRNSESPTRRDRATFFASTERVTHHRVLLVESDESVRRNVAKTLESRGFVVSAVADTEGALPWLDADPLPFDVLVTEVMAAKTNGIALAARARRSRADVAVVLVSSRDEHDGVARAFGSDGAFVRKSASSAAWLGAVEDALAKAHGPR
jgi:signal transduction histidine kinase